MMRINPHKVAWSAVLGAVALNAALLGVAPAALAEPGLPAPPPVPTQAAPLPAEQVAPPPADQAAAVAAGQAAPLATTGEVPHLPSPENLPPGATIAPVDPSQGHGMSYLRELWHAVQTQEVSGSGALLLLTQRPMNPDARPPVGMSAGPAGTVPAAPAPGAQVPPAPPVPAPIDPVPAAPLPATDPAAPLP